MVGYIAQEEEEEAGTQKCLHAMVVVVSMLP